MSKTKKVRFFLPFMVVYNFGDFHYSSFVSDIFYFWLDIFELRMFRKQSDSGKVGIFFILPRPPLMGFHDYVVDVVETR